MRSGAFNELFLGFLLSNPRGAEAVGGGAVGGGSLMGPALASPGAAPSSPPVQGRSWCLGAGPRVGVGLRAAGPPREDGQGLGTQHLLLAWALACSPFFLQLWEANLF